MTLLAILIALGIERFYTVLDEYRGMAWFARWRSWVEGNRTLDRPYGGLFSTLLTVLVPLLIIQQLGEWMADGGWLPELLFSILVLILSIGPRDLRLQVESILESWSRDDMEGGILQSEGLLEGEIPEQKGRLIRTLTEAVLAEANPRLFSVLFWFILLGPAGAILVRMALTLEQLQRQTDGEVLERITLFNQLVAWPSAHLVALSYALVGDFISASRQLSQHGGDWSSNREAMIYVGIGAIRLDPVEDERQPDLQEVWDALEMVRRAEIVWMVLLALLVLVGVMQ